MTLRRIVVLAFHVFGLAAAASACLGPTEITLDVRTNLACDDPTAWRGIAISVGAPGLDVDSRAPVLATATCAPGGEIGTVVIVPTGASNATVAVRVVAGINRKPEDCAAAHYDGCIVARRTLSYLPHQSQHVVVDLTSDCLSNACDVNHTCVSGACTDVVTATPPIADDGGVYDPRPTVRCGGDGTRCPANDPNSACCVTFDFTARTAQGACVAPATCPSTSAVFYCDDSSQCPVGDTGNPFICAEAIDNGASPQRTVGTACEPRLSNAQGVAPTLCQKRETCPITSQQCSVDPFAPGYYSCGS